MKTRICHISSVHPTFDTRIFHKECTSLAKSYEVHLIIRHGRDELISGIHIHALVNKYYTNRVERFFVGQFIAMVKAVNIDAALYHFHDPELMFVGLFLKLIGKKVIYDVHEDMPKTILSKMWIKPAIRRPLSTIANWIEKFGGRYYDGIITVIPEIEVQFTNKHKMCAYNYPVLSEFAHIQIKWDQREKGFVYIGGLNRNRGLFKMIEAILQTSYKLYLAGPFDTENEKEEFVAQYSGNPQICYMGVLDRKSVGVICSKVMGGFVVLQPVQQYIHSLPLKMMEYMAAGIPVISSNFEDWKKIVEPLGCGICIDPVDTDAIVKAMNWIVTNPIEAEKMGYRGRIGTEEKYNWENEEKKLFAFYDEILSE